MTPEGHALPHAVPETVAENEWFEQTFCNGAQWCTTGTGYLWVESANPVTYGDFYVWNGSEATSNATAKFWIWGDCVCTGQILWYCPPSTAMLPNET